MKPFRIGHVSNDLIDKRVPYSAAEREILNHITNATAQTEIRTWPGYAPTPLHNMAALATDSGVKRIWLKDEGQRFGLKSFKALGGAYAVLDILRHELTNQHGFPSVSSKELRAGEYATEISNITVCCATDENHGHAVAWGAQEFGCRCTIYLHDYVSADREDAIAVYGARIKRLAVHYDDSVRKATEDTKSKGWYLISNTA